MKESSVHGPVRRRLINLQRFVGAVERSSLTRVAKVLATLSVIVPVFTFAWHSLTKYYGVSDRLTAWELISKYEGERSNYGRSLALEILNAGCHSFVPSWVPFAPVCERLYDVSLPHANLQRVRLGSGKLLRSNFFDAFLDGASFRGAELSEACFAYASLRGVDFAGANLSNADLREVVIDRKTDFSGATLCNTRFSQFYRVGEAGHIPDFKFDGDRDCRQHPVTKFPGVCCLRNETLHGSPDKKFSEFKTKNGC